MNEAHGAKTEGNTMKKTWKQRIIHDVKVQYGGCIEEYKGHDDDRLVYVGTFNLIIEALNTLPEEPVSYIKVAILRQINHDKEMLDRIRARFTDIDEE